MSRQLIILGHSGFLGRCLYDHFLQDQNYEVHGFSSAQFDLAVPESVSKLSNFLDRDASLIMSASALNKKKDLFSFRKDISMFVNLVNSSLFSKIKHLIYISSTAIYGRCSDFPITEMNLPNPDNFYSSSKLIGELIFKKVCDDIDIGLTILRPGIFYGRGDVRSPLFRFISSVRMGKEIEMHGDESTRLVWVHKGDLWRIIKSVVNDLKFGDYNIVSDSNGISLIDLAETVFKICGLRTGIKFTSGQKVPMNIRFNTAKFKIDFPGFKFINFEDGIKEYIP